MDMRYACIAVWDSNIYETFNLLFRKDLQEDTFLWHQAYDSVRSDHEDTLRSRLGGARLSASL